MQFLINLMRILWNYHTIQDGGTIQMVVGELEEEVTMDILLCPCEFTTTSTLVVAHTCGPLDRFEPMSVKSPIENLSSSTFCKGHRWLWWSTYRNVRSLGFSLFCVVNLFYHNKIYFTQLLSHHPGWQDARGNMAACNCHVRDNSWSFSATAIQGL